jgi:hypothetical protein
VSCTPRRRQNDKPPRTVKRISFRLSISTLTDDFVQHCLGDRSYGHPLPIGMGVGDSSFHERVDPVQLKRNWQIKVCHKANATSHLARAARVQTGGDANMISEIRAEQRTAVGS